MTVVEDELHIKKIKEGTVIDHITAGHALSVLRILDMDEIKDNVVSVVMNARSGRLGKKDIVKVENMELNAEEVDKIALIAPNATINIIRNYKVAEKQKAKLPKVIRGIIKCDNVMCISNSKEPMKPTFLLEREYSLRLRCYYCNRILDKDAILKQF